MLGRPIPLFSSSFTRPASVYLGGGSVSLPSLLMSTKVIFSPSFTLGISVSSPRALGSALNQPGKTITFPVTEKLGITCLEVAERFAETFVRKTLAGAICEAMVLCQISS